MGLTPAAHKRPGEISGGMKQRVGIARALAMEPKVLLMDEPFGALDALTRAKLQDELLEIVARTHSTVVMVTHDVDEAVLLSDKIVMMTNGPAATIGEVLAWTCRARATAWRWPTARSTWQYRKAVIDFLVHPPSARRKSGLSRFLQLLVQYLRGALHHGPSPGRFSEAQTLPFQRALNWHVFAVSR